MIRAIHKFIYLSVCGILLLGLTSCNYDKTVVTLGSEFDNTWSFNGSAGYDFDSNLVEIKNGKAQLKPLDLEDSGADFNDGTHVGSYLYDQKIGLLPKASNYKKVTQILPLQNSSLLAYWRVDGDWGDESGNMHNGIAQGDTSFSTDSQLGSSSGEFDGAGDFVNIPSLVTNYLPKFSISVWVKPEFVNDFQVVVSKEFNSGNRNFWLAIWDDGRAYLRTSTSGVTGCDVGHPKDLRDGSWHHIFASFSDGECRIYVDSELGEVENSIGLPEGIGEDLIIGRTTTLTSRDFTGKIDEIAIWTNQLTETEVALLYQRQLSNFTELSSRWTPQYENIVGYWKMDGSWQDSSGNGNHGTAYNGANFSINSKVGSSAGVFKESISQDYVEIPNDTELENVQEGAFTLMAWYKPNNLPRNIDNRTIHHSIIGKDGNNTYLGYRTDGAFNLTVVNDSPTARVAISSEVYEPNYYYHVVGTFDDTNVKIYVNGKHVGSEVISGTGNVFEYGAVPWVIGAAKGNPATNVYSWPTDGTIDETAIWNTNLSENEILEIYNRQKQKYAGSYDSEVIDLGSTTSNWPDLSWSTSLPFGKELVGDFDNDGNPDSESSSDYSSLSGALSNGLTAYWDLNEVILNSVSGKDFADGAKNELTLNEVGGVLLKQSGVLNNAAYLDGVNDYLYHNDVPKLNFLNSLSTSVWVKAKKGSHQVIIGQYNWGAANDRGWAMACSSDNDDRLSVYISENGFSDSNSLMIYKSNETVCDNTWHHVAFTFDSGNLQIYIDGKGSSVIKIQDPLITTIHNSSAPLAIGINNSNGTPVNFLNGYVDEVAIWDRVLNPIEIQQLYRRGANRVKLQVKSCVDSSCNCKSYGAGGSETDCDGDTILNTVDNDDIHKADFIGPGGDGTTYYSELYNRQTTDVTFNCALNTSDSNPGVCVEDEITLTGGPKPTGPEFLNIDYTQFVNPSPNRYAQYRVYMEADENTACGGEPCLPELSSVSLNPSGGIKYASDYVEVKPSNPINFTRLVRITIDADSCAMFRLARGGIQYYYDSGAWTPVASESDRSPASDLENHAQQFQSQFGVGELEVIGYLKSDPSGNSQCRIDEIDIGYK